MATYPPVDPAVQRQTDEQQLRYLAIANYVYAGLNAVGVLVAAVMMLFVGGILGTQRAEIGPEAIPVLGLVGGFLGVLLIVIPLVLCVAQFLFARSLQNKQNYVFCMVMAVITCLSVPIGTIIGILVLVVLMRPTVKMLFEEQKRLADETELAAARHQMGGNSAQ